MTLQIEATRASLTKYVGYLEIIGVALPDESTRELLNSDDRRSRTSSMITLHSTSSRISSVNDPILDIGPSHFDVHTPTPGRRRSSATDSDTFSRSDTHSRSEAHAADADSLHAMRPRRNSILSQASIPSLAAEVASIDSGPPPPVPTPSPAAMKKSEDLFLLPPYFDCSGGLTMIVVFRSNGRCDE